MSMASSGGSDCGSSSQSLVSRPCRDETGRAEAAYDENDADVDDDDDGSAVVATAYYYNDDDNGDDNTGDDDDGSLLSGRSEGSSRCQQHAAEPATYDPNVAVEKQAPNT